ncbi:MAG: hypothetical protein HFG24_01985 [Anaerotruncus sp.]|jgi:hypothetical protein|nr:hypothetical protein [Clostridiaceae bacterium]MCI9234728.1 hypothetical protein [Anaerotruncus sp.]
MNTQKLTEVLAGWAGLTTEEVEALNEAAQIWAERVKTACEEMAEAISRILSAMGQSDFETLEEVAEKIDKELRAKQRREAREREQAQAQQRASAARFAQYRRQELKWTAGRRVRPRQREYKPP